MTDKNITAEIIADSINEQGDRITSFIVTCPRIVLAEFNTHRMLSRNSASSRAIPFKTMVERVENNPFIPIGFQKDHKGMQGVEYFEGKEEERMIEKWIDASKSACRHARVLNNQGDGVTKQLCNRLLEPFLYHTIIVTATEWENFFALRAHEAAEIHIQHLAFKMLDVYNDSTPKKLAPGKWHIPFGDKIDGEKLGELALDLNLLSEGGNDDEALSMLPVKIATARCARVSYLNYEGSDDYFKDVTLHNRLSSMGHWSPFEHCAKAMTNEEYSNSIRGHAYVATDSWGDKYVEAKQKYLGWSGNLKGFIQYRKLFAEENKKDNSKFVVFTEGKTFTSK